MQEFDTIVIGLGAMGSAAVYHLAARGVRVLGIDQFGIAHDRGSSHGETRIIRKSYFEHEGYVPMVEQALAGWRELESASDMALMEYTGLLMGGYDYGELTPGVRRAAAAHGVHIEHISPGDAAERFPGLCCRSDMTLLFEPNAGFLRPEDCIQAHISQAMMHGAGLTFGTPVTHWERKSDKLHVRTAVESYECEKVVLCGGAWTADLLPDIGRGIEIRRKPVFWYPTGEAHHRFDRGCPIFAFETVEGFFYGFPSLEGRTIKVAEHTGGETATGAANVVRDLLPGDTERVDRFVDEFLPGVRPPAVRHRVCMYSMSPDGQFIVGAHPERDGVYIACGFSGHGFKFAPVIGAALADLVCDGVTARLPDFVAPGRPF